MFRHSNIIYCTSLCLALSLTTTAHATILTFDQDNPDGSGVSNFENIDQTYGDNVTGEPDANGNGYDFGSEGTTPNITVEYTGFDNASADPDLWTTGYGDLTNILFEDADNVGRLNVVFTAAPGWLVELYEFDMASFDSAFSDSSDPTINFVRVLDGDDNELFRSNNQAVDQKTRTPFNFTNSPLTASVLKLQFDSGNLGGLSDDIAFDNIRFGQVVPRTRLRPSPRPWRHCSWRPTSPELA